MTSFFGLDTGQALAESVNLMCWVIAWSQRRYFLPKLRGNLKLRLGSHHSYDCDFFGKGRCLFVQWGVVRVLVLQNDPQ